MQAESDAKDDKSVTEKDHSEEVENFLPETATVKEVKNDAAKKEQKKNFSWFLSDMRKRHLVWVKAIFFFQSASLVTLYPYLAIHMRSLGFSVEDTALVNSAIPLADIIGQESVTVFCPLIQGNWILYW